VFRKKSIDEWALDYWLLQRYARFAFHLYYRKIEIVNPNNIQKNQALIMAPNHQNALMDAMILVCNTEFQHVFLARADIFKGKLLIRFLTYLNIMPIYRIRDGIDNVKRNDEVFDKTLQVLRNKHNPLCVFPEGNHGDKRRLRQLVKGIFRIAFMAQRDYGDKPGVKIIPIGYDYGHYQHFRTTLFINVGKPIEVAEYNHAFEENPVQGINQLKERFEKELRKLMIDIQTTDYYDLYMHLRNVYNPVMCRKLDLQGKSLADKFVADKRMIDALNVELVNHRENIAHLNQLMQEYQAGLNKYGLRDWILQKERYSLVHLCTHMCRMILLTPLFLWGFFNNYLPYWLTASRVKTIKDPQFHSSYKFVIGMIAFPLWYLIVASVAIALPITWWITAAWIVLLPASGLVAFNHYLHAKKLRSKLLYTWLVLKRNKRILHLQEMRNTILNRMNDLIARSVQNNEIER
jgi:1-acyl-sn-glycerol-3-phosphate acyltransferase